MQNRRRNRKRRGERRGEKKKMEESVWDNENEMEKDKILKRKKLKEEKRKTSKGKNGEGCWSPSSQLHFPCETNIEVKMILRANLVYKISKTSFAGCSLLVIRSNKRIRKGQRRWEKKTKITRMEKKKKEAKRNEIWRERVGKGEQ